MSDFNFDAPQYIDFTSPICVNGHQNIEHYFDLDHDMRTSDTEQNGTCLEESPKIRRSLSAGALNLRIEEPELDCYISSALGDVHLDDEGAQPQLPTEVLVVSATVRRTRPRVLQKPRSVSRDALHRLGLPYVERLKQKTSGDNLRQNKYISFAEAVKKFHSATPQRFRRTVEGNPVSDSAPLGHTVPHSPKLCTKMRARPAKFEEPQYEFHARPAPISTTRPQPMTKPSQKPTTKPKTPSFMSKYKKQHIYAVSENTDPNADSSAKNVVHVNEVTLAYDGIPKHLLSKPVRTVLEPFSFDERDKRMQRKKEEKIRKLLEDEKKIKEFHARPVPKIISSSGKVESKVGKLINKCSSLKNDENAAPNTIDTEKGFKARSASVVLQKPFIPQKEESSLLEVQEFQLTTQRRVVERLEFDKKLNEKEKETEHLRKEHEQNLKRQEALEVLKFRKELVHKTYPIKQYKPVEIQPSTKKLTSPKRRHLTKRHNKDF